MTDIWQAIMERARPTPRVSPITGKPIAYRNADELAQACAAQSIIRKARADAAYRGMGR